MKIFLYQDGTPRDRKLAEMLWGKGMPVAMRRIVEEILIAYDVCSLSPLLLDGAQLGSPNLPRPPGYPRGHIGPKCQLMLSYVVSDSFLMYREWTAVIISDSSRSHILNRLVLVCTLCSGVPAFWNASLSPKLCIWKFFSLITAHFWCHFLQDMSPGPPRVYLGGFSFLWYPITFSMKVFLEPWTKSIQLERTYCYHYPHSQPKLCPLVN